MNNYNKIEAMRVQVGKTKQEIARILGVSPRCYSNWRNDDPHDRYVALASAKLGLGSVLSADLTLTRLLYRQEVQALLMGYRLYRAQAEDENDLYQLFPKSYMYARLNRVCPLAENNHDETDPFEPIYIADSSLLQSIIDYLVDDDDAQHESPNAVRIPLDYYTLEGLLGGKDRRYAIKHALTYLYLANEYEPFKIKIATMVGDKAHIPAELKYFTSNAEKYGGKLIDMAICDICS